MSFRKVMKFGGAALADGPAVERACRIVREAGGARPVVVVSAHRGVTALLEATARGAADGRADADRLRVRHRSLLRQLGLPPDLLDRYFAEIASLLAGIAHARRLSPNERDLVLSYGERMSARVVSRTLGRLGVPATPVDAYDLGLLSDSNHGTARPLPESRQALRDALLEVPGVPVVTGFLAKDRQGNLTTLGRNGSDLTAALVAEAVGADLLELWKAVPGVMTADPGLVPDARVIERLRFEEAAELAAHGAEVLHPEALVPARRAGVAVRFLDVGDPVAPGTTLDPDGRAAGPVGLAARPRLLRVVLESDASASLAPRLAGVADLLGRHGVEPALVVAGGERVEVLLAPGPVSDPMIAEIARTAARVEKDLGLVALVGRDPEDAPRTLAHALAVLAEAGVAVSETFTARAGASRVFLVTSEAVPDAVRALHAAFFARRPVPVP